MDRRIYPAVFHAEEGGGYSVAFPDLPGCITEGDTLAEAVEMAEDALGIYLYTLKQDAKELPPASDPSGIKPESGEFINLVKWDEEAYLKRTDNRAVKKTLTIPSWLNHLAEERGVNFSQVLQDALRKQLVG